MFCHCTALKRPVYHTSKWTGGSALGGRSWFVVRVESTSLQDTQDATIGWKQIILERNHHRSTSEGQTHTCMLQKLWEELKDVKLCLGCHHQKAVGNGPFSILQLARLVFKGRLSLSGWIHPNSRGVRARRLWGRGVLEEKLGGMSGFWASWAPPGILRGWLGTTRAHRDIPQLIGTFIAESDLRDI